MNRRTFLKSLGIACGAAIVCPGELVKDKPAVTGIDCNKPLPRKHYYVTYHYSQKQIIAELEKEFWNTKFKSPFMKDIDETTKT